MPWILQISLFDVIIVLSLVGGAAWGFNTGLVRQIIGAACAYLSLLISSLVFSTVMSWLTHTVGFHGWLVEVLVFGGFTLGFYFLLVYLVQDVFGIRGTEFFGVGNRMAGMFVGFALTFFWLALLFILIHYSLEVTWLKWDNLRSAFLASYRRSILAPVMEQTGYLVLSTVTYILPVETPSWR